MMITMISMTFGLNSKFKIVVNSTDIDNILQYIRPRNRSDTCWILTLDQPVSANSLGTEALILLFMVTLIKVLQDY